MRKNKVDIITLGCSKNLVDSEQLMRQFAANGYAVEHDPHKINGEIVVVNTCGFIGDAQEESINMILELGEAKKAGKIGKLFVMGCLSERFLKEMQKELPEVDKFYGKFNWKGLITDLGKSYYQELALDRVLTTPKHYAYLKIAEGCNRTCSYCAIPISTGHYQSVPMEELEREVRCLVAQGVKELQVIAQDLTYYGFDLYKRYALPELVERLSDIPGVEWIRLHYGYPSHFPYELLRVMLKVIISYPKKEEEKLIIRENITGKAPDIKPILTTKDIMEARDVVREVYIDEKIERYIVDIVFSTRFPQEYGLPNLANMT